jgi:aspartyl aminopeptidase
MKRVNAWNTYDSGMLRSCMDLADDYKDFLDHGKTERECVDRFVNEAERNGYIELSEAIRKGMKLSAGDRVYSVWMNKSMVLFEIGAEPLESGLNILGAHIDSPRLDIKQNPMYEDNEIAFLDTHYYGGIKKYQYVTIPLAIHGVIVKKNGETVILRVGEDEDDPVFFISDLLIHLSQDQLKKPASTVVEGEALDLIIGSRPLTFGAETEKENEGSEKEAVKKAILKILSDNYGISEGDFESAELEIVPAGRARDAGFDRSMVLGYGQDDRACAYPSFRAQIEIHDLKRTSCTLLVDKEEIGSVGATGMRSRFFENALAEVMNLCGEYSELSMRRALANSCMLSSDVSAAYDPSYGSVFEKKNTSFLGRGMTFAKYTGSRGKSGSNDANAEYIAYLRGILEKANVCTQTAELGKVDMGGGGTIAYILALYGMNVIDCGVPVLSMHSPWEAVSKADIYETYRGYKAFLRDASFTNF